LITSNPYLAFAGAATLLLIVPGPTNALLLAAGAAQSIRQCLPLIAAEFVAYGLAITPLLVFHEALGAWRAVGGAVLKSLALAIILMIALRLWRARPDGIDQPQLVRMQSVFWMTLFNPKALIFAFALFPPVTGVEDLSIKVALFAVLTVLAGMTWVVAGAILSAGSIRSDRIGKAAAIILCFFAIYLTVSVVADAGVMLR